VEWLEHFGVGIGLLVVVLGHWVRMELKLAIIERDLEWIRGSLVKWGLIAPEESRKS
jgi:hypothetical protein